MTEFSTVANVEVQVDQGSLRSARSTIEDRMGSVRPSVRTDGGQRSGSMLGAGGSGGVGDIGSPASLLAAQLEKLGDIEETIEKLAATGGSGDDGDGSRLPPVGPMAGGAAGLGLALGAGEAIGAGLEWTNKQFGSKTNEEVEATRPKLPGMFQPFETTTPQMMQSIIQGAFDSFQWPELPDLPDLSSLSWPDLPDLPDLSLPDPSEMSDLVLNLPGSDVVSNLTLGLPGESAVSNLVLGLPDRSQLPQIGFDIPNWLENFFGGGGGGGGTVNADTGGLTQRGGNRARERAQGNGAEINIPLDFTVDGLSRRDLERELDQLKRDVLNEVSKQIGF